MIQKRNEATTRRGLGSWKVRAVASFEYRDASREHLEAALREALGTNR